MTDREASGLRGPVNQCSIELDYVYPDHRWVMDTQNTFSLEGNLLERNHRNPDSSHWSIICSYDKYRRIQRKEHLSSVFEHAAIFDYHYDSLQRLDRVVRHPGTPEEHVVESFRYAADGTKTQTTYPALAEGGNRMNVAVCSDAALHLSIDAVAIMTIFDTKGHPARKVLYDVDDRVIRRVAFVYDSQGLLVEEGELIDGRLRDDFRNVYEFDDSGRQIVADMRWGDLGGRRTEFAYNENSDVTEEFIEHRSLLAEEHNELLPFRRRLSYEYDDRGNWLKRVTETVCGDGDERISMIEKRNLIYY